MIGYYVHHHGRGHLHRAVSLQHALDEPVTGLSSLDRPAGWRGDWVGLPLDVDPDGSAGPEPSAGGALHWAPLGHAGLRRRMSLVSTWLEDAQPRLVVCDVSQELVLLCRLHGVPVVSVAQPGRRDDLPHQVGLRAATRVVGFWPPGVDLVRGLPDGVEVDALGALSRFAPAARTEPTGTSRGLVVLGGRGGDAWSADELDRLVVVARGAGWDVTVLGSGAAWHDDPWSVLRTADVVVTHAGQNAVAEVAAARVPAVVVPADRPFAEQAATAATLDAGPWPAVSLDRLEHDDWPGLLADVAARDGERWSTWCDGGAAGRFAAVVAETPRQVAA